MASADADEFLTPSVLDRLMRRESGGGRGLRLPQYMAAIRRDLEWLLNSRPPTDTIPALATELSASVFSYGLPDLTYLPASTPAQREQIARLVEEIIRVHEPRLKEIHASWIEDTHELDAQTVRLRVEARLMADPSPDILFETVVDLDSGHASVELNEG